MAIITTGGATDIAFSPDGQYLYATSGGTITAYAVASGAITATWAVGSNLGALDVSNEGRYVYTVDRTAGPTSGSQWSTVTDYYVDQLDTVTGSTTTYTYHATGYDGAFADLGVLADGTVLLTENFLGSGWEPLTVLNPATGMFTRSTATYAQDGTLNVTPDGRFVAFTPHNISDAPIFFYTAGAGVTASHQSYADNVYGFNSGVQAISPDGQLVAEGINFNIYDASLHLKVSLSALYPELGSPLGLAFSSDGKTLYAVEGANTGLLAFSTADWSLVGQYNYHISPVPNPFGDALVVSNDGSRLALLGASSVELIDGATAFPSLSDMVFTYAGTSDALGFGGNDTITVTGAATAVRSGAGNDRIVITASSAAIPGSTTIDAGGGTDTLDLSALSGVAASASGSVITVTVDRTYAVMGVETVQLGSGNDTFLMPSGSTPINLSGGAGNDTLQGAYSATVMGEAGDDVIQLAAGGVLLTHGTIDGGDGNDRISVSSGFVVDLGSGTAFAGNASYGLASIENVSVTVAGTRAQVTGDAGNNVLSVNAFLDNGLTGVNFDGAGGNDTLTGSKGADTLRGGRGADVLDGRGGADVAVFDGTHASATVIRGGDRSLSVSTALDGTDALHHIEQLRFADGLFSYTFGGPGAPVVTNFNPGNGWISQNLYPRHVADMNGDGYADIVGFGAAGTWISYGAAPSLVVANFGQGGGWATDDQYHRELADVNGDGKADILGFGYAGTWVSLAGANGTFSAPTIGLDQFGSAQGWTSQNGYARVTGDINGDGKADIVGFGFAGTWSSLSNGDGTFKPVQVALNGFGALQGWTSDNSFHRTLADVNGDGKADLVGFGIAGTWVALSKGDGTFADAQLATGNFGALQGWSTNDSFPRLVADVNGDHIADIVGFGIAGTWVSFGKGDGTFTDASFDTANFGANQGWSSDGAFHREVADINHDGLADLVGFGIAGVFVGLNQGDFLI